MGVRRADDETRKLMNLHEVLLINVTVQTQKIDNMRMTVNAKGRHGLNAHTKKKAKDLLQELEKENNKDLKRLDEVEARLVEIAGERFGIG